ncbi:conserved hypothetical protein [Trichormus variabilis ATCC 29413]|uniref:Uncharacterized protein n=2 Tax=Anabaena variabilis TaxID=264691 RepID=Q3M7L7_TRIV2|nr:MULTISPECIES: hypothetical protein [Nostocaceae]ABA23019.1 conserved hypothetical protein [Trichormus variabilis ATCC 29413]MBC1215297.1 hypothetical protein [Trichormus variabilis ARAD]MBC1257641.1 hypothetical protein [Trichormus variabilis V5]MBC1268887.1 hypothetical protein [Trichormus variabilis FSR]MBC1303962.1 hypothetical protein [Trichormus variabilis N2B]
MLKHEDTILVRLVAKFLKYFLLMLFGVAIAYVLSTALGALHIIDILIAVLQTVFFPLGVILLCLITIMVIFESVR